MQIGYFGLGKMGFNMVLRLLDKDYDVVACNRSPKPIKEVAKKGANTAFSLSELVKNLKAPRTVWIMVPAGKPVDEVIFEEGGLINLLEKGDTVIDGGNSFYKDTIRRYDQLKEKGINFLDAGVSGGPGGARNGASIMVGGDKEVYKKYEPLFKDLSVTNGYGHMGPAGAGHFVKMVHNGIEYGMMQSIAEGFELATKGPYANVNLRNLAKVWNHGTVIRGFLMDRMEQALENDPNLSTVDTAIGAGDLGETRWAIKAAIDNEVPFDSPARALFARFRSRQKESFATKVIAAMRSTFGGHKAKDTLSKKSAN